MHLLGLAVCRFTFTFSIDFIRFIIFLKIRLLPDQFEIPLNAKAIQLTPKSPRGRKKKASNGLVRDDLNEEIPPKMPVLFNSDNDLSFSENENAPVTSRKKNLKRVHFKETTDQRKLRAKVSKSKFPKNKL